MSDRLSPPAWVYLGLGSNLGDRQRLLESALTHLDSLPHTEVMAVSHWYESVAQGPEQPDYLNGAVALRTGLKPLELLDAVQAIEQAHDRVRLIHWGPRTLDIDILLWDDICLNLPRLQVPHPYLRQRAFVVLPLLEIAPGLHLPDGQPLASLGDSLDATGLRRLSLPAEGPANT
jgi:2-amino-4-hydroxy-6-hydroxymethyldihydropteridine diphosphokinase